MRITRLETVCAALILASGLSTVAAGERPSLYDYELAHPREVRFVKDAPKPPYLALETIVTVVLDLDKKGRLRGVELRSQSDSLFADYARKYFQSFKFEPARFRGKKTESRLPVSIRLRPRNRQPDLLFPVDDKLQVVDRNLYELGYRVNDIHLPQLKMFPPYFSDLSWEDSLSIMPLVLLKVQLDKEGSPTAIEGLFSTYPALTMPIQSAVLWASFAPARIGADPIASYFYLLVTFPPRADYPTRPFTPSTARKADLAERVRVTILADTVGPMLTPMPQSRNGEKAVSYGSLRQFQGNISAAVSVDTSGRITALRKYGAGRAYLREINGFLGELEMFPAVDFQGKPRPFEGLVHIEGTGSTNVRIRYFWHPSRATTVRP